MATRKILLPPLIYLSSILCCNAGTGGSFTIGADAGLGLSGLYGTVAFYIDGSKTQLTESAGINFRYNFPKIVSIGSGIYYCQFGHSAPDSTALSSAFYSETYRGKAWNTVNIPLVARVSFGKKAVFFAEAGPFLSISLNRPYLLTMWANDDNALRNGEPLGYSTKTFNAGITVGTGIEAPLPHRFALRFEVRSNVGLINIINTPNVITWPRTNDVKAYNCTLLCGVTYTLPLTTSKLKTPD